jgi:hypothetical protein
VVLLSHCSAAPSLAIPGNNVYRLGAGSAIKTPC